ncbi:hypothetical protein PR048_018438 [Dryococelus australis]|uniref:Uncharacterized protein n=1 Tax=Dryococelus australis TaxID=614101 RepID=A0ABQ9HCD0_9NEOP|nr:hypothetical protein PR048_018438 [Dryococelus australis]
MPGSPLFQAETAELGRRRVVCAGGGTGVVADTLLSRPLDTLLSQGRDNTLSLPAYKGRFVVRTHNTPHTTTSPKRLLCMQTRSRRGRILRSPSTTNTGLTSRRQGLGACAHTMTGIGAGDVLSPAIHTSCNLISFRPTSNKQRPASPCSDLVQESDNEVNGHGSCSNVERHLPTPPTAFFYYLDDTYLHVCPSAGGRGGAVVRLLDSRLGKSGSITGEVASGFSPRGDRAGRCRWLAKIYRGSFVFSALDFRHCFIPNFTTIGSQDLDVKSRPNIFTLVLSNSPACQPHSSLLDTRSRRLPFRWSLLSPLLSLVLLLLKLSHSSIQQLLVRRPVALFILCWPWSGKFDAPRVTLRETRAVENSSDKYGNSIQPRSAARTAKKDYRTAVAEWLASSPSTKVNRVESLAGSLPDFRMWEWCLTMPLVGGFSRGSLVFRGPSFRRCSLLASITLGFQNLDDNSLPNLFTHRQRVCGTKNVLRVVREARRAVRDIVLVVVMVRRVQGGSMGYGMVQSTQLNARLSETCAVGGAAKCRPRADRLCCGSPLTGDPQPRAADERAPPPFSQTGPGLNWSHRRPLIDDEFAGGGGLFHLLPGDRSSPAAQPDLQSPQNAPVPFAFVICNFFGTQGWTPAHTKLLYLFAAQKHDCDKGNAAMHIKYIIASILFCTSISFLLSAVFAEERTTAAERRFALLGRFRVLTSPTRIDVRRRTGFSQARIVPDDAVVRQVFSGTSRFLRSFIPAPLHAHSLQSPSSALKTSPLRAAQISSRIDAIQPHLTLKIVHGLPCAAHPPSSGVMYGGCGSAGRRRASLCCDLRANICVGASGGADLIYTVQRYDGNTARLARRSDEALGVRVTVACIAPSLLDRGRAAT